MLGTLFSILMLASVALAAGGVYAIWKIGDRKRGILMMIAAGVLFANVLIATIPLD